MCSNQKSYVSITIQVTHTRGFDTLSTNKSVDIIKNDIIQNQDTSKINYEESNPDAEDSPVPTKDMQTPSPFRSSHLHIKDAQCAENSQETTQKINNNNGVNIINIEKTQAIKKMSKLTMKKIQETQNRDEFLIRDPD